MSGYHLKTNNISMMGDSKIYIILFLTKFIEFGDVPFFQHFQLSDLRYGDQTEFSYSRFSLA